MSNNINRHEEETREREEEEKEFVLLIFWFEVRNKHINIVLPLFQEKKINRINTIFHRKSDEEEEEVHKKRNSKVSSRHEDMRLAEMHEDPVR